MKRILWYMASVSLAGLLAVVVAVQAAEPTYVKKANRVDTVLASLKASGLPTLAGPWYYAGPFDNTDGNGFDAVYGPEKDKAFDPKKTYSGKDGAKVGWHEFKDFKLGTIVDLKKFKESDNSVIYLEHEFEATAEGLLPISLGSDDTLTVWFNGEQLLAENATRPAQPDQNQTALRIKKGKNRLLIKVCNVAGDWAVYVMPEFPATWPGKVRDQLVRDYPGIAPPVPVEAGAESKYYKIVTLPIPKEIRAGSRRPGHAARRQIARLHAPRRGLAGSNPNAADPTKVKFTLFATGLHEALGLHAGRQRPYVVQRPELTKLVASRDPDVADQYETVCDKWGVSGDYHEFAFGPARDKDGNFYVTLNVGFGGGHQSKRRGAAGASDLAQGRNEAVRVRPALAEWHQL